MATFQSYTLDEFPNSELIADQWRDELVADGAITPNCTRVGTTTTDGTPANTTVTAYFDADVAAFVAAIAANRNLHDGSAQAPGYGALLLLWGSGAEGDVVLSSSAALSGVHRYQRLTIDAGVISSLAGGDILIIYATERVTVNGTINAKGTQSDYNTGGVGTVVMATVGGGGGGGGGAGAGNNGSIQPGFPVAFSDFYSEGDPGSNGDGGAGGASGMPGSVGDPATVGTLGTVTPLLASIEQVLPPVPFAGGGLPGILGIDGGVGGTGYDDGGGAAGGGGPGSGGVGGFGGGQVIIIAPTIEIGAAGIIDASGTDGGAGGAGGNGFAGLGTDGGGGGAGSGGAGAGGGAGGGVMLVYETLINNGTILTAGGVGGAAGASGVVGAGAGTGSPGGLGGASQPGFAGSPGRLVTLSVPAP